jgi:hypothetical protein
MVLKNQSILTGLLIIFIAFNPARAQKQEFGGKRIDFVVDGHNGFIVQPLNPAPKGQKPWVWYAPTIGNYPNHSNAWIMERLVQHGFYVCGVDVGESYGNAEGRKVYSEFYNTLRKKYHLNKKACLIPQSRGGLMLYNWAEDPGNAKKVSRIAGIYPIGDISSWPGISKGAKAYNMSPEDFVAHIKNNNPIDRLQPLCKAKVKIFHIHGDSDTIVPLLKNSQVLVDRYKALGGDARLKVISGKGHQEIPEYFQSQELLDFLLEELK